MSLVQMTASVGAVGGALATWRALLLGKRIEEVHVLVNSQLSEVMQKLAAMTAERDELAPERAGQDPKVEVPPAG